MTTENTNTTTLDIGRGETLILPQRKTLIGGLKFEHRFSKPDIHPYDEIPWDRRDVEIMDYIKKRPSFSRKGIEVPAHWSDNSVKITAAKYLFGSEPNTPQYEDSLRHPFDRIANTYTVWGWKNGYFESEEDAKTYNWELKAMLLKQIWAPNSPVWFNLGHWEQWRWGRADLRAIYEGRGNHAFKAIEGEKGLEVIELDNNMSRPQSAACFLTEVEDSMESILHHQVVEGRVFASGSGAGINISKLRSSKEPINGKGRSSGPIPFNKGWDRMAGAIKSGGKCLAPWQLVYTEGGPKKVSELAEKGGHFVCVSYDPMAGRVTAKPAQAWMAEIKEVVEIITDKGTFALSSDHPVRTSDEKIVKAGDLQAGIHLHAGSIDESVGYLRVHLQNGRKGKEHLHRLIAKDIFGETLAGKHVHHKNGDKHDNRLENLEVLTTREHHQLHNAERVEAGEHQFQLKKYPKTGVTNPMHQHSRFWTSKEAKRYRRLQGEILKNSGRAQEMQKKSSTQRMLNMLWKTANAGGDISTFDTYHRDRTRLIGKVDGKSRLKSDIQKHFGSFEGMLEEMSGKNHTVVAVRRLGKMETYDVEVTCPSPDDKTAASGHNFLIWNNENHGKTGSGIFVLNTRRAARMVLMDSDHPDTPDFIGLKNAQEDVAKIVLREHNSKVALKKFAAEKTASSKAEELVKKIIGEMPIVNDKTYDGSMDGEIYGETVSDQNANHSVSLLDDYWRAYWSNGDYSTRWVTDKSRIHETFPAKNLMVKMAESVWHNAEPGCHNNDWINLWNPVKSKGRIDTSNPCVTGDTLVAGHGLREIGKMVGEFPTVVGGDGKMHAAKAVFPTGTKQIYVLETESGFQLRLTADHLVLTKNRGDVAAKDLTANDSVILRGAEFVGISGYPTAAYLAGLALGSSETTTMLSPEENKPKTKLALTFSDNERDQANNAIETAKSVETLEKTETGWSMILDWQNDKVARMIETGNGGSKQVSSFGLGLDKMSTACLIQGLMDRKGEIKPDWTGSQNPQDPEFVKREPGLSLELDNERLLSQIQVLLLSFGIKAKLARQQSGPCHPFRPTLRITGQGVSIYAKDIGSRLETHITKLKELVTEIEPITEITDRVARITAEGEEPVFDLTEPETSHFVANGIVVHNCSEYLHINGTSCLSGETEITTPDGLETIKELLEKQKNGKQVYVATEIQSETNHNRMRAFRPAVVLEQGEKPVFRIETKDGRSIRATADHRFLTETGWKRVDEMVAGKTKIQIATLQNSPPKRPSEGEDAKIWRLLGWIAADGTFSKDILSINFAGEKQAYIPEAKETLDLLVAKATAKYGDNPSSKIWNGEGSWTKDGQFNLACSRQSLIRLLEQEYGMEQGTGPEKSLPKALLTGKSENQIAFLQALFGGDGCLLDHPDAEEKEVMLATSSPKMATGVQAMLALYGITSRITWHHPEGRKNPQAQIHIRNQQQRRFASLVGFKCNPPKEQEVSEILLREELQREHEPRNPTVTAIVPDGYDETYDISEPETHSFIANGFISHNCNLSSFNAYRFLKEDGSFDKEALRHGVRLAMIAADLNIEECGFPDPDIAKGTYSYRTTGIGYGNIGGLLMALGIPYDSDEGRYFAGLLVSHLTAYCWEASQEMGEAFGPFREYEDTKNDLAEVLRLHKACHDFLKEIREIRNPEETMSEIVSRSGKLPTWGTLDGKAGLRALLNSFEQPGGDWDPLWLQAAKSLENEDPWKGVNPEKVKRNSFVSLSAPGGTISAPLGIYDSGTTSIEPDYTLVKYKTLAGGGSMTMFNNLALKGLQTLGYDKWHVREAALEVAGINGLIVACDGNIQEAAAHLAEGCGKDEFGAVRAEFCNHALPKDTTILDIVVALSEGKQTELPFQVTNGTGNVEGIPWLPEHHRRVFDCAATLGGGKRSIEPAGHIKMLGAIQPFLSGSSSKTCNLPHDATVDNIVESFELSHKMGVKCIALYRADSKGVSVYSSDSPEAERWKAESMFRKLVEQAEAGVLEIQKEASKPRRRKLPGRREGTIVKFVVGGQMEGFLVVGIYPDGRCGEVFGRLGQGGSFSHGMFESFCKAFSVMLQWGVPLPNAISSFRNTAFDPSGFARVGETADQIDIKSCKSVVDLMMKMLEWLFPEDNNFRLRDRTGETFETEESHAHIETKEEDYAEMKRKVSLSSAESCPACGKQTYIQDGKCKKCVSADCLYSGGGCGG